MEVRRVDGLAISRLVGNTPERGGGRGLAGHTAIVADGLLGHPVDRCLIGLLSDEYLQEKPVRVHHVLPVGGAHDVTELLLDDAPLTLGVHELRVGLVVLRLPIEELPPVGQGASSELRVVLVEGNDPLEEPWNRVRTPSVPYEQRGVLVQYFGFERRSPVLAGSSLLELVIGSGIVVQQAPDQRQHEPVAGCLLDRRVAQAAAVDHAIRILVEEPDGSQQGSSPLSASFDSLQDLPQQMVGYRYTSHHLLLRFCGDGLNVLYHK